MSIAAWFFAGILFATGAFFLYLGFAGGIPALRLFLGGRKVLLYILSNEYVEGGTSGQAPVYEIAGGDFAGKRVISTHSTHPPLHRPGEVVEGRHDPETGATESDKILWRQLWIEGMLLLLGTVPMTLALMILF